MNKMIMRDEKQLQKEKAEAKRIKRNDERYVYTPRHQYDDGFGSNNNRVDYMYGELEY